MLVACRPEVCSNLTVNTTANSDLRSYSYAVYTEWRLDAGFPAVYSDPARKLLHHPLVTGKEVSLGESIWSSVLTPARPATDGPQSDPRLYMAAFALAREPRDDSGRCGNYANL